MPYQRSLFDEDSSRGTNILGICDALGCPCNTPGWPDSFGNALSGFLADSGIAPVRTLSLFSGAGGLDIGFQELGFDIVESVEVGAKFAETLKMNSGSGGKFGHSHVNCTDIRDYSAETVGEIDFIIGGPPCQTFSAAGRRVSGVSGLTDSRGVLFREYVRLLNRLRPKGFLFENVYGITGAQNGEAWEEIRRSFREAGYTLHYMILDAADYGVPQHRERLIIVGLREGDFLFPRPTHGPDSAGVPFYNAGTAVRGVKLDDDERKTGIGGRFGPLLGDIPPGLNYSFYTSEMGHPNPIFAWRSKFSDFLYKADPEEPVRTIKAQGGQYTGPLHWDNRYFSCSEYKRLQTFPDDYIINGSRLVAIHQIGNSVPPQLARMLALAIRIQVFGTRFPFRLELLPRGSVLTFRKRKKELTASYRKKAAEAIERIKHRRLPATPRNRSFFVSLSERFKYMEAEDEGRYRVRVIWSDRLVIDVAETGVTQLHDTVIRLTAAAKWDLPVSEVRLTVSSADWDGVTAAWKVLDRELAVNSIKADLVQLNGYYQYSSGIVCELLETSLPDGHIFGTIFSGECVGRHLTTRRLAEIWRIEEADVLPAAMRLRALAYEIRNRNTNPQMNPDEWLLPYKFPTLLPESVQLNKKLISNQMENNQIHLDVYPDRSELHYGGDPVIFREGKTNAAAVKRYDTLKSTLDKGYLDKLYEANLKYDFTRVSEISKKLLTSLVDGITSETGRALVGLTFLQLTIKSIVQEQSVRLHKGSSRKGSFSWEDGIPMRVLDNTYTTPFLREKDLLNINKDGVMMTRSLAENYPYSRLFKADMRGPFAEWISIVDALEDGSMEPEPALNYLLSMLMNRSRKFGLIAEETCGLLAKVPDMTLEQVRDLLSSFYASTQYSARAFEVVIHGFMQALCGLAYTDLRLEPLSQMRSANKKHGNVGDIEMKDGNLIVESWDAKFGKPYLYEELSELKDKLDTHPGVRVAGFIVDDNLMLKKEIEERRDAYSAMTNVDIRLFNFVDWVGYQTEDLSPEQQSALAREWLRAVVETFARRREEIAPVDEPCENWLSDMKELLKAITEPPV